MAQGSNLWHQIVEIRFSIRIVLRPNNLGYNLRLKTWGWVKSKGKRMYNRLSIRNSVSTGVSQKSDYWMRIESITNVTVVPGPVAVFCMVYHYTKRATSTRLLGNVGPAIYVVLLNKYFVILSVLI